MYLADIRKEYGYTPVQSSYWVLLTKDVIPGSRNKSCDAQAQLLKECNQKANASYELPGLLETATSIFMEYLRTGQYLYNYVDQNLNTNPTYIRCRERISNDPDMPLVIGSLYMPHYAGNLSLQAGLMIRNNESGDSERTGIGVLRKFL